jgi:hypothetical protein
MDKNIALRRFLNRDADSIIAAACGFFMLGIFTRYGGIGISPDSIMYMSGARNMNAHKGFTYFGDKPLVAFPLFYPTFLGILLFVTGIDPLVMAPVLNGLLFGLLIFLVGFTVERFLAPAKWYKWFILLAIVLSPSLLEIYSMLWSETLFIVWSLTFIIVYHHYLKTYSINALLIVAGVTALACVTRYAGVTLMGTGGMLLFFDPRLKLKTKVGHIVLFTVISSSLLAINLIHNSIVTNTGTGPRYKSLTSLSENMHYFGTVMCDWFTISHIHYNWAFGITLILVVAFVAAFIYHAAVKKFTYRSYENLFVAFFIVYGLFMIISATISRYERINNRLLSPLFIPFLIGCSYWIVPVIERQERKIRRIAYVLSLGLATLFIYGEVENDRSRYDDQGEYGTPGYTDDDWNKSKLIETMKTQKDLFNPAYPVYNNACEAFYFFTGKASDYIPKPNVSKDLARFDAMPHGYVVMFNNLPDPALLTIPQIQQRKKQLKVLYQFADGGIYEF